jgi:hypothetical protein
MKTSLGLILNKVGDGPPPPPKLAKPGVFEFANGYKLILTGGRRSPTKMRKGKSGEIERRV